jgi:hypothetical protein
MSFSLFPHFITMFINCIVHGYLAWSLLLGPIHYVYSLVVFKGGLYIYLGFSFHFIFLC